MVCTLKYRNAHIVLLCSKAENFWPIVLYVLTTLVRNITVLTYCPDGDLCHGLSWALHTGTTETRYILVAFTNIVIHQSVLSLSQDIQIILLGIRHCEHFHSICIPISLFSILVWCSDFHWVWWLGSHAHLTGWGDQVTLCPYFPLSQPWRNCLVWLTSISPEYCSYLWLLAMYGRYCVYLLSGCGISMQLVPHLVGQLLLLFVQVWWHVSVHVSVCSIFQIHCTVYVNCLLVTAWFVWNHAGWMQLSYCLVLICGFVWVYC